MVYVVDGVAHPGHKTAGNAEYKREPTKFALDGQPLDLASTNLHLYVCAACPWAHRALVTRNLSATLRAKIKISVVSPFRDDSIGWEFLSDANRDSVKKFEHGPLPVTPDASPLGAKTLLEVYLAACPEYSGNITTPTLYDAVANKILSNDSFEIMRIFVDAAALHEPAVGKLYGGEPTTSDEQSIDKRATLRAEADRVGRHIDEELGKCVYMCGLAKTQTAYESSLTRVFCELDRLEALLGGADVRLLGGTQLTVVDIQALCCLSRFDPVYFDLFKCFTRRISSYPNLCKYLRSVAAEIGPDAFALDLNQVVHHYWTTFTSANPNGVVPIGYRDDFLDGGFGKYKATPVPVEGGVVPADGVAQAEPDAAERRARGEFVRGVSAHRNWLGDEEFPVDETDRYILFVANNCPWCHRARLAQEIFVKDFVRVSVLFYRRGGGEGAMARWRFLPKDDAELMDFELGGREVGGSVRPSAEDLLRGIDREDPTGNGFEYATDIYKSGDEHSKETSVPILFDRKTKRVVSNESADIVRMFSMLYVARRGGGEEAKRLLLSGY